MAVIIDDGLGDTKTKNRRSGGPACLYDSRRRGTRQGRRSTVCSGPRMPIESRPTNRGQTKHHIASRAGHRTTHGSSDRSIRSHLTGEVQRGDRLESGRQAVSSGAERRTFHSASSRVGVERTREQRSRFTDLHYSGAKFCSDAPLASSLPRPPTHWLTTLVSDDTVC